MDIDRFDGRYRFLSNFFPETVLYDGYLWPTAEHAFQAAKTKDKSKKMMILSAQTPGQAKRMGRSVNIRPDWESVKIDVMKNILRAKFEHPALANSLKATAPRTLIEGNDWGDMFWGRCNGVGDNWLGRLLMEIRDEIA